MFASLDATDIAPVQPRRVCQAVKILYRSLRMLLTVKRKIGGEACLPPVAADRESVVALE